MRTHRMKKNSFNKENKGEEGEKKSTPNKPGECSDGRAGLSWPVTSYLHPSSQFIFCT